ncbi:hypothetical protein K439DRAFT_1635083 [Ramaria rubella]|nr:hypothetical protein K439DRAFT_1635083 [Ramaria rubella]
MVSALLNDALRDPVAVILTCLNGLNDQQPAASDQPTRVARLFHSVFKDIDALKQIPATDFTHTPESYANKRHPLIRFRAMVQDTSASPEIYPSLLRNARPGGWGLAEVAADEDLLDLQHLKERDVVWAISVPGESSFVAQHFDDADSLASIPGTMSNTLLFKDPLMRKDHVGMQVKIYDSVVPPLKPTDLHTFVGLLTFEPLSSGEDDAQDGSQVPTLHCLFSVKHPSTLLSYEYPLPRTALAGGSDQFSLSPPRAILDELVQWVADEALGGDRDAALWVLLVSIARVQSRHPPLFPPSLTLSKFPKPDSGTTSSAVPALTHVLRHLLPIFVHVPLSLPLINSHPFSPESRKETLHSGLLQLPAGTTVLLSDSGVQEGKITESGLKNIQALQNALTMQTVDYHFPFASPYQFPTDLSFILITEGKKCAFGETQLYIPMECKVTKDCFRSPEDIRLPSLPRLESFRNLLGGAKIGDVKVTEEISEHIQADFVKERRRNSAMTADDLMIRISIARLLALLRHDTLLTTEVWQAATDLDDRRKQRC